jgi:7-keto-8-aminopelargonate synthetase-like enzyme
MKLNDFLKAKKEVEAIGFNPYFNVIQSDLSDRIIIDNKQFINFASNNYLGLANDERIKKASIDAIKKYGVSLCGTPIACGYIDLFQNLEKRLAGFVGCEDALILPSCYQANNGLFSTVIEKNDIVIFDKYAHSSLIEGIKLSRGKARYYLHNNMTDLENILKKSSNYSNKYIVTESVFSIEGSVAPVNEILDLCKIYNAKLIIDDSHGIGVLGEKGKGVLEYFNIKDFDGVYTASLGKAFANAGGMIASKNEVIDFLRFYTPHLIYSTAITPATLGGIEKTLDIIEDEFLKLKEKLFLYKNIIKKALKNSNFDIVDGSAPINSINTNSKENTIRITKDFYDNGLFVTPFIEPSTPLNKCKIRLIAGANLQEETINEAANIIEKVSKKNNEVCINI